MKKRLLTMILSVVMVLSLMPTMALAADTVVASGNCGAAGSESSVTWALTQNNEDNENPTYTLTISGAGAMCDYIEGVTSSGATQPWKDYANQITRIVVEDGVTHVGNFAFNGVQSVTTYSIGKDVATVGSWAIDPTSVTEFEVASDCEGLVIDNGALLTKDKTELLAFPCGNSEIISYTLPAKTETISEGAFSGAKHLKSVDLANVETIETFAFFTAGLTELILPSSVTSIGNWAFTGCSSLEKITFSSSNLTIGQYPLFPGCNSLKKLIVTKGASIEFTNNPFRGTGDYPAVTSLEQMELSGSISGTSAQVFLRAQTGLKTVTAVFNDSNKAVVSESVLPSVEMLTVAGANIDLGNWMFGGHTKLKTVTIKATGVVTLGERLFNNVATLETVVVEASSISLGKSSFAGCSGLKEVDLTGCSGVTYGEKCFPENRGSEFVLYVNSTDNQDLPGVASGITVGNGIVINTKGGTLDSKPSSLDSFPTVTKGDYEIGNWYIAGSWDNNTSAEVVANAPALVTETYQSRYSPRWVSNITFDANGGTGTMDKQTIAEGDTTTALTENTFTRTGYTFAGWNTKADGSGQAYADKATTKPSGSTTLYAQWEMGIGNSNYTVDAILDKTYTGAEIRPDVVVRDSEGVQLDSGYTVNYTDNVNVGTASVTVAIGEQSATVNFQIVKDNAPTISMSDVSVTYGTGYTMTATAKTSAGNEITGENVITIKYYTDEECSENETETAPTNAGTYWAKATLTGTDNYAEVSKVAKITISNATFAVSAEGWSGPYDGKPHSITVTADDATITYSATENGNYTTDDLQYTNAGTYTVYYKASKANHDDVTGSVNVEISKATPAGLTITANNGESLSLTGGGTVTLTVAEHPENAEVTVTCDDDSVSVTQNEDGTYSASLPNSTKTYTFTASYAESTNYNAFEVSCTVAVTKYTYIPIGPSTPSTYAITVADTAHGDVDVNRTSASKGTVVTITVDPDQGYELVELTVTNTQGHELRLTSIGGNKYTFEMPAGKVTVNATFKKQAPSIVFTDVFASDYYYDAVYWAVENGVTNGTNMNPATFSPLMDCTRAQAVTFLWRAAGSPEPKTTVNPFTDVSADDYYCKAVLWAVENGITNGTNAAGTTFSPNLTCTRAQVVTFLYRLAGSPAVYGSNGFSDVADDAYYADAVQWAVANGITYGTGTNPATFSPDMNCNRSQIVTFLYRYFEK